MGEFGGPDAVLYTSAPTTDALAKAPRALGEALAAMVAGNLPVNWGSSNGWSSDFCSADALLPRTSPETISMVANAIAVRRSTRPRPKECWGSRERNDRSDLIQRRRVNQVGDPIDWHGATAPWSANRCDSVRGTARPAYCGWRSERAPPPL